MDRRTAVGGFMALGAAAAAWRTRAQAAQSGQKALPLKPPASDPVKVAVIISADATSKSCVAAQPLEVVVDLGQPLGSRPLLNGNRFPYKPIV